MSTIGMITTSYPTSEGDPSGRFVYEMALALAARGHQVEVVAPEPAQALVPATTPEGVATFFAPYIRPRRFARLFYEAGVLDNLRLRPYTGGLIVPAMASLYGIARRRSIDWDAVISHWLLPSGLIGGELRRSRRPVRLRKHLAIAHSGDVHLLSRLPLKTSMARRILTGADHLGFVSRDLRERFARFVPEDARSEFERRTVIAPMGTFVVSSPSARKSPVSLLFIGRLVPVKGVDVLLRALAGLAGCRITIAGDGPERAALERLSAGLDAPVEFIGGVTPAQRDRLLAECDIVVVPSRILDSGRTEGLPLAVVEGMAAGKPVIASNVGGVSELVVHRESGWLAPPGDANALREGVATLIADAVLSQQLADAGLRAVSSRRWGKLAERYLGMLGLESGRDMG